MPLGTSTTCQSCPFDPGFDLACAPYLYMYPVQHLVRGLKFEGRLAYGRVLGQLLAEARVRATDPLPEFLIPIPLHPDRYRNRGFNQAEKIASSVAHTLQIPLASKALVRIAATREQTTLTVLERRDNVRGAFRVHRLSRAAHVALVDDVLTTGSTASEAARVLKEANVDRVEIWTPARVHLVALRQRDAVPH
jgi:ComF family protein